MQFLSRLIEYLSIFLAILVVLPLHEFAHAFVANKLGDPTAKNNGRLTLNPFKHFDTYGLISLVLVRFGWAKPVPINPYNFKKPRKDMFLVSIAGVIANLLLAFIAYPIWYLVVAYLLPLFNIGFTEDILFLTLYYIFWLSISFFVFNLLPFYPLDGFRVVDCFSKKHGKVYCFLRDYGQYILLGLVALSFIGNITGFYYIDILGNYLSWLVDIISKPIMLFWGLIF